MTRDTLLIIAAVLPWLVFVLIVWWLMRNKEKK